MIIEQQLHGYRHGHELLSGTVRLPAKDQDLIDRLSDIAGPLGPGERFSPYLTSYPLPSGSHYVIARTWQDREAPRAGCVRTRSLIIPMSHWMGLADPAALAAAATDAGPTSQSKRISIERGPSRPLPPVEGTGIELLEALFLEDPVPVAVFGATSPEPIALRLLSAIWPSMRRRFTVSTFCNSPRTIAKKSFDLVFAPVDARPRFSDWKGRRVDGTRTSASRHRWSTKIVDEVFKAPHPSLMGLDVFGEMANDERGSEEALRLSLLWEELSGKIESEPHAALGLLDIANTRSARRADLVEGLAPALAKATKAAVTKMSAAEAWRFLQVLIGKLGSARWQLSLARAVRASTMSLASRQPLDAIAAIPALLVTEGGEFLLSGLATGLAQAKPFRPLAQSLAELSGRDLLKLLFAAPDLAGLVLSEDFGLEPTLEASINQAPPVEKLEARRHLMQHLVKDRHAGVLRVFLSDASADEVLTETGRLRKANELQQAALNGVIVEAAQRTGASRGAREVAAAAEQSPAADGMLRALIEPTAADVDWILDVLDKSDARGSWLLVDVLGSASQDQLRSIIARPGMLAKVLDLVDGYQNATDLLVRIVETVPMDAGDLIGLVVRILPNVPGRRGGALAARGLEAGLGRDFGPSRDQVIAGLLDRAGGELNGARSVQAGVASGLPLALASRNLILFDKSAAATRICFLRDPEALAEAIIGRHALDLSYSAAEAVGRLLWDSAAVNNLGFLRASAKLLSFAMREKDRAASPIIAASFPSVYSELQQDRLPDFLSFVFPFLDWDRCKIARKELAQALLESKWRPRDIALAAARAGDAERILRHIAKREHGPSAISSIESEVGTIPDPWGKEIRKAIKEIKGDSLGSGRPFDS